MLDYENDLYCFIGALFERGLPSGPQLDDKNLIADLRQTISAFRNQVYQCQQALKENDKNTEKRFGEDVREYAATLLGGQINSAKRRQIRIQVFVALLNDRVKPVNARRPSELQRRLVWAQSPDRKCARCQKAVEDWRDYDCGHVDPKAFGGRPVLSNLRVEHKSCNRKAGAKN